MDKLKALAGACKKQRAIIIALRNMKAFYTIGRRPSEKDLTVVERLDEKLAELDRIIEEASQP